MVFVSGPRQIGKTTLCKNLAPKNHRYINWDILTDREFILKQKFPIEKFIVYDEIHKFTNWRNYIKGLYDQYKNQKKSLLQEAPVWIITDILVTLYKADTIITAFTLLQCVS